MTGDVSGDHWTCLRALLPLYQAITTVKVKDGKSCSFWADVWLGDEALEDSFPALFSHCTLKQASVHDVFELGLPQILVPRLSTQATSQLNSLQLLLNGVSLTQGVDIRTPVMKKRDNSIDTGSLYRMLKARGQDDPRAAFVWKNSAPPRVQLFMWLLLQKKIQCKSTLFKRHVVDDTTCEICGNADETPEHIIWGCSLGRTVWQRLNIQPGNPTDMASLHTTAPPSHIPSVEFPGFIALICWEIWKARNAKVFRGESLTADHVLLLCKNAAAQWKHRLSRSKKQLADTWCSIFTMARQGQG